MQRGKYIRTEEMNKKTSESLKGHVGYWKGKTKETDESLRKLTEKSSKTRKERIASGEIVIWNTGLTKETDERVAKAAKSMIGKISWCKDKTKETDERLKKLGEKVSKTKLEKHIHLTDEHKDKIRKSSIGRKEPDELRMKRRIIRQKQIEEAGGIIQIGHNETKILNEIEQKEGIVIDRNFRICGYYPDGYCHETNTIYEIYEKKHLKDKQKEYDAKRQKEIEEKLKCRFIITWDML